MLKKENGKEKTNKKSGLERIIVSVFDSIYQHLELTLGHTQLSGTDKVPAPLVAMLH